jgi:hypothetical protein
MLTVSELCQELANRSNVLNLRLFSFQGISFCAISGTLGYATLRRRLSP